MSGVAPLRAGIVGAGWIGARHAAVLAARDDVRLTAVCDVDGGRAAAVAAGSGAAVFTGWQEMLRAGGLDALWVCTPPRLHRAPAVAALTRGLPVYLEKPVARSLDDAAAIVAAGDGVVCAVGYQWHALDVLDELRSALGGRPAGCLAGQSVGGTESRPWFLDRAAGGGNLLERGSHHIDLARAIGGEVTAVQAAASAVPLSPPQPGARDIEDAVTMILHFAAGGIATILVAWTADDLPGSYWVEVNARGVSLRLDLDPSFRLSGVRDGVRVGAVARAGPFERSVAKFIDAVRAGEPGLVCCGPADAMRTLAVAVAAEEALATGGTVPVALPRPGPGNGGSRLIG